MASLLAGATDMASKTLSATAALLPDSKESKEDEVEDGYVDPAKEAAKSKERQKRLKAGDYQVILHVIEARDLHPRDMGDTADPVAKITVTVGTKKISKTTKIFKNAFSCLWDQLFVFEFKNCTSDEIEGGRIDIGVYDANTVMRDVEIGSFGYDMTSVYYREHHELYRQWVALSDHSNEKNRGIQGYLKSSVTVLGPGDEQHIHGEDDEDEEDQNMMGVLMPPHIEQKGKLLKVDIFRAEELPSMDDAFIGREGSADPFLVVSFAGASVKNKKKTGKNVSFNESLHLPVYEPIMARSIQCCVFDYDAVGTNDRICNFHLDYVDMKENNGGVLEPRWYNLYGAPHGKQRGVIARKMNRALVPGTAYRGRVLVGAECKNDENPSSDCVKINGISMPTEVEYNVEVDFYEGVNLVSNKGKLNVKVSIGQHSSGFPHGFEVQKGIIKMYKNVRTMNFRYPQDLDQVPDCFVYLMRDNLPICYKRFTFRELIEQGQHVPPAWHDLIEDPVLDFLSEGVLPGSLLFGIRAVAKSNYKKITKICRPLLYPGEDLKLPSPISDILDEDETAAMTSLERKQTEVKQLQQQLNVQDEEKKAVAETNTSRVGSLYIRVVKAAKVEAMDRCGTSDPYVTIRHGKEKFQTSVKKKTLDPVWDATKGDKCEFKFSSVPIESSVMVKMFDWDRIGSDEIMGRFPIDLRGVVVKAGIEFGKDFEGVQQNFLVSKTGTGTLTLEFKFVYLKDPTAAAALEKKAKAQLKRREKAMAMKNKFNVFSKQKEALNVQSASTLGNFIWRDFQLRVHLYQARHLPATDDNGLCDPYVIVMCGGVKIKFPVCQKTLHPVWYVTRAANIRIPTPLELAPHIQVAVFDKDLLDKDDPVGRCSVSCLDALMMNQDPHMIEPRWLPLYDWNNNLLHQSKLMISFQLLTEDQATTVPVPRSLKPKSVPMTLEVISLGLRDLQSTMGIHKTYIRFDLPHGKHFLTKKSKNPTARNPNFLQVLEIPIEVPLKRIYAAALDLQVRDTVFGGMIDRLVGAGSLNISDFLMEDPDNPEGWIVASDDLQFTTDDSVSREKRKLKEEALQKALVIAMAEAKAEEAKAAEEESIRRADLGLDDILIDVSEMPGALPASNVHGKGDDGEDYDAALEKKSLLSMGGEGLSTESSSQVEDSDAVELTEIKHQRAAAPKAEQKTLSSKNNSKITAPVVDEEDTAPVRFTKNDDLRSYDFAARFKSKKPTKLPQPAYMQGRAIVDDELEDNMDIAPFQKIKIKTGQAGGLLGGVRDVGHFKGIIRVRDPSDTKQKLELHDVLHPKQLFLRVYVLRGINLAPRDYNGTSDPYLIVKCGKKKFSTRKRYIQKNLNPGFYESFEFPVTIPGNGNVNIGVWDYDGIGDDLIGSTSIDIEDRWFTTAWRVMDPKPLERRTLHCPTSSAPQGKLEVWVELVTMDQARDRPLLDIKPPPPLEFDLRVVIWKVDDVPHMDDEGMSDLYVTGHCSSNNTLQKTDVHLRAKHHMGSFNWRMVWPITLDQHTKQFPYLRLQIWDADLFSANDAIAETTLNLKALCKEALRPKNDKRRVQLTNGRQDVFWIENLYKPGDMKVKRGKMQISVELCPKIVMQDKYPAGKGRDQPNQNPYLPPPEGRMSLSFFHPIDMCIEIIGPNWCKKMACLTVLGLFLTACAYFAPMLLAGWITG